MNVLILSAAAKVLLVRAFQAAARPGRVFAADLGPDNAALFEADGAVLLPRTDAPGFPGALAKACAHHGIGLVVPTRDADLPILAGLKAGFAALGVTILVAEAAALATCQDKRAFVAFCAAHGFATPRTFAPSETPEAFPVFVRPATGAGGRGARRVDRAADLPADEDLLVQTFETAPEWSVDVLMDLAGRPLQAVPRRRLQVRDGEAVKSRTENVPALTEQSLALCAALGLVGHNVVQAFYSPETGVRFVEINPRFGGASNLSIQAGLASPERILQMVAGDTAKAAAPRALTWDLTMLRYSQDRFVDADQLAAIGD